MGSPERNIVGRLARILCGDNCQADRGNFEALVGQRVGRQKFVVLIPTDESFNKVSYFNYIYNTMKRMPPTLWQQSEDLVVALFVVALLTSVGTSVMTVPAATFPPNIAAFWV